MGLGLVDVGVDSHQRPVSLDLSAFPHMLIAGLSGHGKSSLMRTVVVSLASRPDVQFLYLDPKMTEGQVVRPRLAHLWCEPEELIEGLRLVHDEIRRRARRLSELGEVLWQPTVEEPWIVLLFDEVAALMATGDAKQRAETERLLHYGITISRALGVTYVLSASKPDAETVASKIRDGAATRVCMATVSPTGADVTLGPGWSKWADTPALVGRPGVGYVLDDPKRGPVLTRFFDISAEEARKVAAATTHLARLLFEVR